MNKRVKKTKNSSAVQLRGFVDYNHVQVEREAHKIWNDTPDLYSAPKKPRAKKKFFPLIEFPFPSGDGLHTGHIRSYTAFDIIARKHRMLGEDVLYAIGWDAFGLPAEQYAIKVGIHPKIITKKNTDNFRRQLKMLGFSFDWNREINTSDPTYYKWTQWIFLKLYERGLAFQKETMVWWCEALGTVLANEEVIDGRSERGNFPCERRPLSQWILGITKYADRLYKDIDSTEYIDRIKTQQKNWIGKSEGVLLKAQVDGSEHITFEMFDSIPQTCYAQSFVVIAPEHPQLFDLVKGQIHEKDVLAFAEKIKQKRLHSDYDPVADMEGIFTGRYVWYPITQTLLPIWVASYVVADYGTGVVSCSAHDERDFAFAKKFNIPLKGVLVPKKNDSQTDHEYEVQKQAILSGEQFFRAEDGILTLPQTLAGKRWDEVREPMIEHIVAQGYGERSTQFKLRDWVFSRQRYWGEPFPMVWIDEESFSRISRSAAKKLGIPTTPVIAEKDGQKKYAVPIAQKYLPVELPDVKSFAPKGDGKSALGTASAWLNVYYNTETGEAISQTSTKGKIIQKTFVKKDKGTRNSPWVIGVRETDTMPNWAGSSWYWLRYADPHNKKEIISRTAMKAWTPVDWYNGGMEHTTLHLLYARFWNKFLADIGVVDETEPFKKRTSHGMILGEGGVKMSKSLGNVVNPDGIVERVGADTLRIYEMFAGPFDQSFAWSTDNMVGARRFVEKVWNISADYFDRYYVQRNENTNEDYNSIDQADVEMREKILKNARRAIHKAIKKVGEDIESLQFNTAISEMMILVNTLIDATQKKVFVPLKEFEACITILAPFAPFMTEVIWQKFQSAASRAKKKALISVHKNVWPKYEQDMLVADTVTMAVQVNGKVRATIEVGASADEEQVKVQAFASVKQWVSDMNKVKKVIIVPNRIVNIVVIP